MTLRRLASALALLAALLLGAAGAAAQGAPRFSVRAVEGAGGWQPAVEAVGLLHDRPLRSALDAGLPLRFRLRVELWRKGFFDRLVDAEEVGFALLQDPLDRSLTFETTGPPRRYATLAQAEAALDALLRADLRATGRGRFYYLATLSVETLSLSDLEELRRWLRGEVQPAVEGSGSAGRAVERGLRRVFVRVIGLPTRRLEDRSGTFVVR